MHKLHRHETLVPLFSKGRGAKKSELKRNGNLPLFDFLASLAVGHQI